MSKKNCLSFKIQTIIKEEHSQKTLQENNNQVQPSHVEMSRSFRKRLESNTPVIKFSKLSTCYIKSLYENISSQFTL